MDSLTDEENKNFGGWMKRVGKKSPSFMTHTFLSRYFPSFLSYEHGYKVYFGVGGIKLRFRSLSIPLFTLCTQL